MEQVTLCNVCGRPFEAEGLLKTCKACFEQDMEDFNRIRDYLFEHPRAKIFDVATNLDIQVTKIKRFLRESRLEIVEKDNGFLKCEKCGKPITSGTECEDCRKNSSHDYKSAFSGDSSGKRTKINYLK